MADEALGELESVVMVGYGMGYQVGVRRDISWKLRNDRQLSISARGARCSPDF